MTTLEIEATPAGETLERCQRLGLRLPENRGDPGAAVRTFVWEPDLTPAEEELLAAASSAVPLTAAEFAAIRPQIQILRELRQLGRNAYMALTAAERDRMMYDAMVAVTVILIGQYREELAAAARNR